MSKQSFRRKGYHLTYTRSHLTALVLLRVFIGWHFLYEGLVKLANPIWSSSGYLAESKGLFAGLFQSILTNPSALRITDFMNIWGLILIGTALIAGCLTRVSALFGIILLLLYYFANPPWIGYSYSSPSEGSYLLINKNLIETAALYVIYKFPNGNLIGLDRLIFHKKDV